MRSRLTNGLVFMAYAALAVGCGPSKKPGDVAANDGPAASPPIETPATDVAAPGEPLMAQAPESRPAATDAAGRNRLGLETSPYLLQHQHNPVHWYPWGPEAFEAARRLDRPIFLSVGYSTCYWCHVMERECFENEAIAEIMNEHFVCIKVDREERPDVDDIYMTAVQLMTRQGGWPMSMFLEPNQLRPFLGGTYFPPDDGMGRPGFPTVLRQVAEFWSTRRDDVLKQAEGVADAVVQQMSEQAAPQEVGPRDVERAITELLGLYDKTHGGYSGSENRGNKFPVPPTLDFLIGAGWELEPVRKSLRHTLDRMATGGMYDQVGGGFHRYSTDPKWLVPHFEKMLYDNGQLASTYAEAHARTGDAFYAEVLRETLDYVLREMTAPEGAFLSAQDAEVNHREGENYLWTEAQLRDTLVAAGRADDVEFALKVYGVDQGTNFQDPHHPEDEPKNVLFLVDRPDVLAERRSMELEDFEERLATINEVLLATRDTRDQPLTDDKTLTGWNGLMIAGMADGGRVLNDARYRGAAERAADRILATMRTPDGGLLRTSRLGRARIDAFFEDYAFLAHGLIALHRATRDSRHLRSAVEIVRAAQGRFHDDRAGGYFDTLANQSDLFVRTRSTYDGAVPSGNSVMINNLIDLHELTGEDGWLDDAMDVLEGLSATVKARPTSAILTTLALHRLVTAHPDRFGGESIRPAVTPFGRPEPVTISVSESAVRVPPGGVGSFDLTLRVGAGFHVNSHAPGIEYLVPLSVQLVGADGLELEVAYPAGERYDGPEGVMNVHHGTVTIPIRVRRTGAVSGRPRITVQFQACTNSVCMQPETMRVPVAIISE